ncbi:MAG: alpha/beta hydrolase [Pseudonocardiaceae bacterium]
MLSLVDIRQWKPADLDRAFAALGTHRDTLVTLDDDLARARHPAGWTGAAAEAAVADFDRVVERMRRIVAGVAGVRRAVGDTADAVIEIQRALAEAEGLAWRHGFAVGPDAEVIDVAPPEVPADQVEAVARERATVRDEVTGLLTQVLRRATEIDTELTAVLHAAARFEIENGTTTTLAGAAAAGAAAGELSEMRPPQDGTPQQVASWWAALSESERAILTASRPDLLGNLGGIPAQVRDEANRAQLPEQRAALQDQATQLQAAAYGDDRAAAAQLGQVHDKLRALDAIDDTLARGDRQLLLLDTSGQRVKAAVAIGNVDTADHVAVFTPGFTSTVEGSLAGYDDQMRQLQRQAENESRSFGDGGSVAAVTWIGYEAPQWGEIADPGRSVLGESQARTGGAALGGFLDGIDAAHPDDPHLTAIGHSYGSTTTGHAVQQTGGVDDVIFFGSPGIGTSDIRDLHVAEGHAYVVEARNDPVADLGRFGDDPNQLDGLTDLSSSAARTPDGRELTEVTGHSNYLAPDSTSQHNMSVVVAGVGDRAIDGENTGRGDHAREFLDDAGGVIGDAVRKARDIVPGS